MAQEGPENQTPPEEKYYDSMYRECRLLWVLHLTRHWHYESYNALRLLLLHSKEHYALPWESIFRLLECHVRSIIPNLSQTGMYDCDLDYHGRVQSSWHIIQNLRERIRSGINEEYDLDNAIAQRVDQALAQPSAFIKAWQGAFEKLKELDRQQPNSPWKHQICCDYPRWWWYVVLADTLHLAVWKSHREGNYNWFLGWGATGNNCRYSFTSRERSVALGALKTIGYVPDSLTVAQTKPRA